MRVIEFSIDPHGVRGLIPLIPENALFNIPILLWIISGFMLFLYWYDPILLRFFLFQFLCSHLFHIYISLIVTLSIVRLELLSMTGIQELVRIHRFRLHLIVLAIVCGSVVIPTSLWSMFSPGSLSLLVYNAFLSLV